jgi:hypothetical protein
MTTRAKFESLVASNGSDVVFHREQGGTVCPCVSPEGYRDLTWHKTHPDEPLCNEQGRLDPVITNLTGKGVCPAGAEWRDSTADSGIHRVDVR